MGAFGCGGRQGIDKEISAYLRQPEHLQELSRSLELLRTEARKEELKRIEEEEASKVKAALENPVNVVIGTSPIAGDPKGAVTIVLFADFECPFSRDSYLALRRIVLEYTGVALVYKHLPLSRHRNSKLASFTAMSAAEQNKFWEFADLIYRNQELLAYPYYVSYIKRLGLDMRHFEESLVNNREQHEQTLARDLAQAKSLTVDATPVVFINGVRLDGARDFQSYEWFVQQIVSGLPPRPRSPLS